MSSIPRMGIPCEAGLRGAQIFQEYDLYCDFVQVTTIIDQTYVYKYCTNCINQL
jgi:hypothetical protein